MFVLAAVITLSLGIGMTTAIFSLADAALVHPLPIPQVEHVVQSRWSHLQARASARQPIQTRGARWRARAGVVGLVVRQGAWPVSVGLGTGLMVFWLVSGTLRQFALSQPVFDRVTVAALAVGAGVLALVAMIVPARRALAVDPATTLRQE